MVSVQRLSSLSQLPQSDILEGEQLLLQALDFNVKVYNPINTMLGILTNTEQVVGTAFPLLSGSERLDRALFEETARVTETLLLPLFSTPLPLSIPPLPLVLGCLMYDEREGGEEGGTRTERFWQRRFPAKVGELRDYIWGEGEKVRDYLLETKGREVDKREKKAVWKKLKLHAIWS